MCPITVKRIQVKLLATSLLWWMALVFSVYSCFHVASVCILGYPVKGTQLHHAVVSMFTFNFLNFLNSGSCGSKRIKYRSVMSSFLVYSVLFLSVPIQYMLLHTVFLSASIHSLLSHSLWVSFNISAINISYCYSLLSLLVSALEYVCRGPWYDCVFEGA